MGCTLDDCPYIVLGVSPSVSDRDLRSAYRRLMKEIHPDINHSPDATERAKRINIAWQKVEKPQLRRAHDATCIVVLEQGMRSAPQSSTPAGRGYDPWAGARPGSPRRPPGGHHRARWHQPGPGGARASHQPPPTGHRPPPGEQTRGDARGAERDHHGHGGTPRFEVGQEYVTHNGEVFRILAIQNDWAYIRFKDGREVSKDLKYLWESWQEYRSRWRPGSDGTAGNGHARGEPGGRADRSGGTGAGRTTDAPWTPSAADERVLAWRDTTFVVGHWYAHQGGVYEVVGIFGHMISVRYPNGVEERLPRALLREEWVAIRRAWFSRRRARA